MALMKRELNIDDDDAIFPSAPQNSFNSFDTKGHEMKTFQIYVIIGIS